MNECHPPLRDARDILSERELQVLELVALGFTNKEIACKLDVTSKSVSTYRARVRHKLGLKGRAAVVRYALRTGILESG